LAVSGQLRLAGYVEASHGCAHPVPSLPRTGRLTTAARAWSVRTPWWPTWLSRRARCPPHHLRDPDFLNGPHHAVRVVGAVHGAFPPSPSTSPPRSSTSCGTATCGRLCPASGCSSPCRLRVGQRTMCSPGWTRANRGRRDRGRGRPASFRHRATPSLMPFTPWTTAADVRALLDLVSYCDLVGNVDPVHFAIRLLVPPGFPAALVRRPRRPARPYDTTVSAGPGVAGPAPRSRPERAIAAIAVGGRDDGPAVRPTRRARPWTRHCRRRGRTGRAVACHRQPAAFSTGTGRQTTATEAVVLLRRTDRRTIPRPARRHGVAGRRELRTMAPRQARPPRTPADEAWRGHPTGPRVDDFPDPMTSAPGSFDVTFSREQLDLHLRTRLSGRDDGPGRRSWCRVAGSYGATSPDRRTPGGWRRRRPL